MYRLTVSTLCVFVSLVCPPVWATGSRAFMGLYPIYPGKTAKIIVDESPIYPQLNYRVECIPKALLKESTTLAVRRQPLDNGLVSCDGTIKEAFNQQTCNIPAKSRFSPKFYTISKGKGLILEITNYDQNQTMTFDCWAIPY